MSYKQEKTATLLKHLAAEFLQNEATPLSLITVTDISLSSDRKHAIIFISVLPPDHEEKALAFAQRKKREFKEFLKKKTRMGFFPSFRFEIDHGEKNRQNVDALLNDN